MFKKLVKDKSVKVILLEIFLIILGVVGLTLGVKYIMNNIGINVGTSTLAIDNMNATVSSGNLSPVADSSINVNTTSGVLRITFDVKGASTNTGDNIIYDAILNIEADCALKNENIKWNLYKNSTLLTSGTTSPKYDVDVINGKITLTDTQQDLVPYSGTADKYVFILWMSDNCTESDITKCDINSGLNSNMSNKTVTGNIDIRLNSGKKKVNNRVSVDVDDCPASAYIMGLDDGTTGDYGSGVYKVTHSAIQASSSATGSEIPAVTDYRYYGPSPNNYICLDMDGGSTCPDKHLYRIIGSIYEEKENTNRIKVIKATPLTDGTTKGYAWDSGNVNIWATITNGNYSNSLTSGASLMKLLNSGDWWNRTNTFANYGLTEKAKSYITTSRYYLGGYNNSNGVMTNQFYAYERGTTRYDTNRPLYWDGYVGLMYPSDYGYAAGNTCVTGTGPYNYYVGCKNKDWLWMTTSSDYTNNVEWLMSPRSGNPYNAFGVSSSGYVGHYYNIADPAYSARPVFYLSSSASISEGDGTSATPYILS